MWPIHVFVGPTRATTTTIRILGSHTESVLVSDRSVEGFVFFSAVFYDVLCAEKLL